ncbi:MAG: LytTR family DNA-binding domain-containing protein [Psychrobium sp.]
MVIAGLVIGLLAPFGMVNIPVTVALNFWVIICVVGYGIYAPLINACDILLDEKISARWLRVSLGAFSASLLMSLIIPVVSNAFFDISADYWSQVGAAFFQTAIIGGVISVISLMMQLIGQQQAQLQQSQQALNEQAQVIEQSKQHTDNLVENLADKQLNQLMEKVPLEKRGQLLCLEMDDHYLNIHTDKGTHMALMRFKDALALLKDCDGLQTHRSWWVATDAIVGVEKEGRKTLLRLSNDVLAPVSRTYQPQVNQLKLS